MTTRAKNWILRPNLVSARWIEEESTILVADTFCVLTGDIITGCVTHPASSLLCSLRLTTYRHPVQRLRMSGAKGAQSFQKFRRNLKILDAGRMTWREFHTEYPQIVGATVHNLVSLPIWCPRLVHPWVEPYLRSLLVYHKDRCVFVIKETEEHITLVV